MRGVSILNLLFAIIDPLPNLKIYFSNITELLEGMDQYQQQRTINFYENYGYHQH